MLELAAALKAEGRTLIDQLDDIYREHGLHATSQLSVRVEDLSIIARAMETLRTSPPSSLGGLAVTSVDDLADGYRGLPPTDGIRLGLEGNTRIIARPSGTEPKLKCYIEVVVPVEDSIEASREDCGRRDRGDQARSRGGAGYLGCPSSRCRTCGAALSARVVGFPRGLREFGTHRGHSSH